MPRFFNYETREKRENNGWRKRANQLPDSDAFAQSDFAISRLPVFDASKTEDRIQKAGDKMASPRFKTKASETGS
jgi:hypothetical protein